MARVLPIVRVIMGYGLCHSLGGDVLEVYMKENSIFTY